MIPRLINGCQSTTLQAPARYFYAVKQPRNERYGQVWLIARCEPYNAKSFSSVLESGPS